MLLSVHSVDTILSVNRRSDGGAKSGEFFLVGQKGRRQTTDKKRSKNFILGSPHMDGSLAVSVLVLD